MTEQRVYEENVGGKVVRLTRMKQARFPVKDCVCINILETEGIIRTQEVPLGIVDRILNALNPKESGFAVRSSAVGEDGRLSWAGQFESLLFVSRAGLEKAVVECANAQSSKKVKSYAEAHSVEVPKLALFVQEMVDAKISGVLFTENPIKADGNMVIEAVEGVGESLVSGRKEPARYFVNPESMDYIKDEGSKDSEVFLAESQIRELVLLGTDLSELFGAPQDIEWAIEEDSDAIFILQSRDITSGDIIDSGAVESIRNRVIYDTKSLVGDEFKRIGFYEDVFSDQNIAEIITTHPCQMAFGLFTFLFAHGEGAIRTGRNEIGYEIGSELDKGFFILVGGQPRCSIVHDAFTYRIKGIPLEDYFTIVKSYLRRISENEQLANYPEVVLYEQNPSFSFLNDLFTRGKARIYYRAYQEFFANFRKHEFDYNSYCRGEFIPEWHKRIKSCQKALETVDGIAGLAYFFKEIAELTRDKACRVFVKGTRVGFFSYARLRNLLNDLFGEEGEKHLNVLASGIPLETNINLLFSIKLAELRDGRVPREEVIGMFGHLGVSELEISVPRYQSQPEFIDGLAGQIFGDPKEEYEGALRLSFKLKERLLKEAGSHSKMLEKEIGITRQYLPLREVLKFEFLRGYHLLRQLAERIEKNLGWPEGLVFNLNPEEIFKISRAPDQMLELATVRRERREEEKKLYIPPVFNFKDIDGIGIPRFSDDRILKGIGVTNHTSEGEVVVVKGPNDEEAISKLKPGSVLVTTVTDPAWTPALSIITSRGGLITEVGGTLAHAAIYAREVGMAAVLNVARATEILKTGMKVRINGVQGYVEIINN